MDLKETVSAAKTLTNVRLVATHAISMPPVTTLYLNITVDVNQDGLEMERAVKVYLYILVS
jgi:hypothetical protein